MTCYYNLCSPFRKQVENCAQKNAGFFNNQVLSRAGHLVEAPLAAITHLIDGAIGAGCGLVSIATLGMFRDFNTMSLEHLHSGGRVLDSTYRAFLKTINPKAHFNSQSLLKRDWAKKILDKADKFRDSGNFLKKYVASRLTYALWGVASAVSRVAYGIIGVIAIPLSLLTLGTVYSINDMASQSLRAPLIIHDLFHSILRVINPWA